MSIINSISKLAADYRVYAERSGALESLRKLSDHQLADIGVERHLLALGVSAYPWKAQPVVEVNAAVTAQATPVDEMPATPVPNFATTLITLYSAWGRPIRAW